MGLLGAFLGHLGPFLALLVASLGGFSGPPAPSEPYLGGSWGQFGLPDRFQDDFGSKTHQISAKNHYFLKV